MSALPCPPLPAPHNLTTWPGSVYTAYQFIKEKLEQADGLLRLDNGDVGRLGVLKSTLETETISLVFELAPLGLPASFIDLLMESLAGAIVQLESAIEASNNQCVS